MEVVIKFLIQGVGAALFMLGVLLLLVGLVSTRGATDLALLGCLLLPAGILIGYLGSKAVKPGR